MQPDNTDITTLVRSVLVAIDETTRERPMETVKIVSALGAVAATAVQLSVAQPDTSSDVMGEMILSTAFRDTLAALRTPTPPEPAPLHPRKRSRSVGKS